MRCADRGFSVALLTLSLALVGCSGGSSSDSGNNNGGGGGGSEGGGGPIGPEPGPLTWYLAFEGHAVVDSELRTARDIISYQPENDVSGLFASIGVEPSSLDAFERVSDSNYYFSLRHHATIDGFTVAPGDVVQYLSGTYALAFEARTAGLPAGVNVDAVAVASNGDLVISTGIHFSSGGDTFSDSDLVRVNDTGFSLFMSASDLDLGDAADISGASIEGDSKIYLSVSGHGRANNIAYSPNDILSADTDSRISGIALEAGATVADGSSLAALSVNR